MAYPDKNGDLITNTPDPNTKKLFPVEDIKISAPNREETANEEIGFDTITFYNKAKGLGFINDLLPNEWASFHHKDIPEPVDESARVKFLVEHGRHCLNALQAS